MRPQPHQWLWRRVRSADTERGATLLLALIFITVIALTITAVLSVTFANLRATAALREQAATAALAEGAAQIAINELRRGGYTGPAGPCFGDSDILTMPAVPGGTVAAAVECARDGSASSLPSPIASLPYALVTLPQALTPGGDPTEAGILIDVQGEGNKKRIDFSGNVASTGTVHAVQGITNIINGTLAADDCEINSTGEIVVGGTPIDRTEPDPTYCDTDGAPDPDLLGPTGNETTAPPPTLTSTNGQNQTGWNVSCSNNTARVTFEPGIYTSAGELNDLTTSCPAQVVYDFRPGVYWFNFQHAQVNRNDNFIWNVSRGTLIAGSPTALPAAAVTTFPTTACDDPGTPRGVTFVFGGRSQWSISNQARVQVCGRPPVASPSGVPPQPPMAIYGLKGPTGGAPIPAQSDCVTAIEGGENGNNPQRCRMLQVSNGQLYVRGATYAPLAWIGLSLNDTYAGGFAGGIVARRFEVRQGTGSVTFTAPFATAPPGSGEARTVVRLTVYVCPGSTTTCDTTGRRYLTATVGISDPSGTAVPGQRRVTVYSWNVSA